MKFSKLINTLIQAIPEETGYSYGEQYGAYNCKDLKEVQKVLYCVTIGPEIEDYFLANGYDLLISHHPFNIPKNIPTLIFHTALDCCQGGLNDIWADILGIKNPKPIDKEIGRYGEIDPISFKDLVEKIRNFPGDIIGETYSTVDVIKSVAVCTGLGGLINNKALQTGVDCYIIGENIVPAKQTGIPALIEVGHTLSERVGVIFFQKILPEIQVDVAPLDIDIFNEEVYRSRSYQRSK